MKESTLIPFVRKNLDILFVGLNPAEGSSQNRHYFSVNQAFWNQLLVSGLICQNVDKVNADDIVFGSNKINNNGWSYGITDLINGIAESNSKLIKPSVQDCIRLETVINEGNPRTVVLLHGKVVRALYQYLHQPIPKANSGFLGKILPGCDTEFFSIAFPHGNAISSSEKINQYIKLKKYLDK